MATSEPSASPSGFSCVTRMKRSASRSSRRISSRDAVVSVAAGAGSRPGLPVDQLGQAHPALDAVVVDEVERRRVLERSSLATRRWRKPWAERRPSSEASRADRGRRARSRRRGHGEGLGWSYGGHGDETDARVLQVRRDGVAEHLPHGLVDPADDGRSASYPCEVFERGHHALDRAPCGKRASSQPSRRSAASSSAERGPGRERGQQRRALPAVLVADLGHGRAHALAQMRLDRTRAPCAWPSGFRRRGSAGRSAGRRRSRPAPGCVYSSSRSTLRVAIDLEHVAFLDVLEVLEHDAALLARRDLLTSSWKRRSEAISPS